jgi:hypothetical protein
MDRATARPARVSVDWPRDGALFRLRFARTTAPKYEHRPVSSSVVAHYDPSDRIAALDFSAPAATLGFSPPGGDDRARARPPLVLATEYAPRGDLLQVFFTKDAREGTTEQTGDPCLELVVDRELRIVGVAVSSATVFLSPN